MSRSSGSPTSQNHDRAVERSRPPNQPPAGPAATSPGGPPLTPGSSRQPPLTPSFSRRTPLTPSSSHRTPSTPVRTRTNTQRKSFVRSLASQPAALGQKPRLLEETSPSTRLTAAASHGKTHPSVTFGVSPSSGRSGLQSDAMVFHEATEHLSAFEQVQPNHARGKLPASRPEPSTMALFSAATVTAQAGQTQGCTDESTPTSASATVGKRIAVSRRASATPSKTPRTGRRRTHVTTPPHESSLSRENIQVAISTDTRAFREVSNDASVSQGQTSDASDEGDAILRRLFLDVQGASEALSIKDTVPAPNNDIQEPEQSTTHPWFLATAENVAELVKTVEAFNKRWTSIDIALQSLESISEVPLAPLTERVNLFTHLAKHVIHHHANGGEVLNQSQTGLVAEVAELVDDLMTFLKQAPKMTALGFRELLAGIKKLDKTLSRHVPWDTIQPADPRFPPRYMAPEDIPEGAHFKMLTQMGSSNAWSYQFRRLGVELSRKFKFRQNNQAEANED